MDNIIITQYYSPIGELIIGSYHDKICLCDWADGKQRRTVDRRVYLYLKSKYEYGTTPVIEQTIKELAEYFDGKRKEFTVPIILTGSEYQCIVWEELRKIPFGTTISYAELVRRIEHPKASKAVSSALSTNPLSIIVPCHRIIASKYTFDGYVGGLPAKEYLLTLESGGPEAIS